MSLNNKQSGAVSLFIVIFSALLITIVTVSFVGIMVKNQQQASNTDLSQSAYDSAQAGVEDAKRALIRYQNICTNGGDCAAATAQINSTTCNTAVKNLTDVTAAESNGEIKVQTGSNDALNQAYTCVKINLQTNDYTGVLNSDASKIIPLVGESDFNTIKLEWFSSKDLQGSTMTIDVPTFSKGTPLLSQNDWTSNKKPNRPSIMRTQLIAFSNSGFALSDFDTDGNASGSNNTLYLYPSDIASTTKSFVTDVRKTAKSLTLAHCDSNLANSNYACSTTITLPNTIKGNDHTAYLNLAAIYKSAHYRITLMNGVNLVKFNAVQPEIDSTGRTNDLFRRVDARVELTDVNFPYPEAAVYTSGSICKEFLVTDNVSDYNAGSCAP